MFLFSLWKVYGYQIFVLQVMVSLTKKFLHYVNVRKPSTLQFRIPILPMLPWVIPHLGSIVLLFHSNCTVQQISWTMNLYIAFSLSLKLSPGFPCQTSCILDSVEHYGRLHSSELLNISVILVGWLKIVINLEEKIPQSIWTKMQNRKNTG